MRKIIKIIDCLKENFLNFYYFLWRQFEWRWFKWGYQRIKYGFSDRQLWSLDYTIAKFIYPRLKRFQNPMGHPYELDYKTWVKYINEMTEAFRLIILDNNDLDYSDLKFNFYKGEKNKNRLMIEVDEEKDKIRNKIIEERNDQIERGLELFSKYFRSLWD